MKKIIISTLLVIFSAVMIFVVAEDTDSVISNKDVVKEIELSDYYGMTSLIVNLHLELGRGSSDEEWIFYVMDLLDQMKYYADLDVIDYLWYTLDIGQALDSMIFDMSKLLDRSMSAKVNLKNNLAILEQKKEDCDVSKGLSDKNFALALKDFDSKSMEFNLDKSLEYEKCAWDARIYYNVQDKMLDKLNFYYEILENKYTYYTRNKAEIILYYPEISYKLIAR